MELMNSNAKNESLTDYNVFRMLVLTGLITILDERDEWVSPTIVLSPIEGGAKYRLVVQDKHILVPLETFEPKDLEQVEANLVTLEETGELIKLEWLRNIDYDPISFVEEIMLDRNSTDILSRIQGHIEHLTDLFTTYPKYYSANVKFDSVETNPITDIELTLELSFKCGSEEGPLEFSIGHLTFSRKPDDLILRAINEWLFNYANSVYALYIENTREGE